MGDGKAKRLGSFSGSTLHPTITSHTLRGCDTIVTMPLGTVPPQPGSAAPAHECWGNCVRTETTFWLRMWLSYHLTRSFLAYTTSTPVIAGHYCARKAKAAAIGPRLSHWCRVCHWLPRTSLARRRVTYFVR